MLWLDNGAHVINMSLGVDASSGMTSDSAYGGFVDSAQQYAYTQVVTVVAASGNDGYAWRERCLSKFVPNSISVGAVGFDESRAAYSNYGTGLDLVAPGGAPVLIEMATGTFTLLIWRSIYLGIISFRQSS